MPNFFLKRDYRTPAGLFVKSVGGKATYVPEDIVEKYGLPKTAEPVGKGYRPPAAKAEDGKRDLTAEEQGAYLEAEITNRVQDELDKRAEEMALRTAAKKAKEALEEAPEDEPEDEPEEVEDNIASLLDSRVKDIVLKLPELSLDDLNALHEAEEAGKARKGLIVEIEAAIEDKANQ